ncbi:hypothetical protein DVR12_22610 [Chitinophaga silvatica]|uniref:Wadjet protein JetD C-terminal domain-containing protein n=1 Tax=Chitinophaga silvatica TaxID=2282649 RepID=A0A3E1Y3Z2_9BACT|nr:hypothetical protein [Chitinophaga silvatica]RFS19430.1 hypothetical protein DVR12_22610 [Chitinophaga silvatica]
MLERKLKWSHLRALNELYTKEQTSAQIQDNAFIQHLKNKKRLIANKPGYQNILIAKPGYLQYYQDNFLKAYERYTLFLQSNNITTDGRHRFDEYDLETFAFIMERKEEILASVPSIRQFSSRMFKEKGSKYLDTHPGIASIVLNLLNLEAFPGSDTTENQWRFVIDHPTPNLIVLCENIANLKRPWVARTHKIELWYVGGNNTTILEQISPEKLEIPLLYSCDWDQHGLEIYKRIHEIFNSKNKNIQILTPYNQECFLPESSPNHGSKWKDLHITHQWKSHPFNKEQTNLLSKLINNKQWIEEESQDLVQLLQYNGFSV